jgi:branched-chain amino acid transport system substrate-binding protein
MKKFLIPVVTLVTMILILDSCKDDIAEKTIDVRGLFSLTGNWSSLGIASQAAMDIAADDINEYLDNKNSNFKLGVNVSDTQLDTELAKNFFAQAKDDGITFIIGPQSSAELAAIKPFSDAEEMIVISQSSTAGSLAIANDNIFRFSPSDKIEGAAMANTIYNTGFRGLVTVARDDAGNKGLQTSTQNNFVAKGGSVIELAPYATTLTDYTSIVADIKAALNVLLVGHPMNEIGVYLASFDEGVEIMKLAATDSLLSNVKWFGGDGVVLSSAFTNDPAVAEFVIKTSFFAPVFGLPVANESQWKPIAERIKAITGTEPDAFALAVYDIMWTIAYTIEENNGTTDDFAQLKTLFIEQANTHSGITGSEALDAAGDRATGVFDYFSIVKEGSAYVWKLVGKSDG